MNKNSVLAVLGVLVGWYVVFGIIPRVGVLTDTGIILLFAGGVFWYLWNDNRKKRRQQQDIAGELKSQRETSEELVKGATELADQMGPDHKEKIQMLVVRLRAQADALAELEARGFRSGLKPSYETDKLEPEAQVAN